MYLCLRHRRCLSRKRRTRACPTFVNLLQHGERQTPVPSCNHHRDERQSSPREEPFFLYRAHNTHTHTHRQGDQGTCYLWKKTEEKEMEENGLTNVLAGNLKQGELAGTRMFLGRISSQNNNPALGRHTEKGGGPAMQSNPPIQTDNIWGEGDEQNYGAEKKKALDIVTSCSRSSQTRINSNPTVPLSKAFSFFLWCFM